MAAGAGGDEFLEELDDEADIVQNEEEEDDLLAMGDDPVDEPEDGIDLIGDGMDRDYTAMPAMDTYDPTMVDDRRQYATMSADARAEAERAMARRDRERGRQMDARGGRVPAAFLDDEDADLERPLRRRRLATNLAEGHGERQHDDMEDAREELENIEDQRGPLKEWVALENVRAEVKLRFSKFLHNYASMSGSKVYQERIRAMAAANRESLEVHYFHLSQMSPLLAVWVADAPSEMLKIFDEVALEVTKEQFPHYDRIRSEIHVRITDLPISDTLRDLRQLHLNALIKVPGVVTRRTSVFPQLKYVKYDCLRCGHVIGPIFQNNSAEEVKINACSACNSTGPFTINMEQTVYRNYQKITLQESPGTVPPGRLPRTKDVILLNDLIDIARPGEEVEVTGVYRNNFDATLNSKNGFPVFSTVIEANYISKKHDTLASFRLTEDDRKEIRALAQDPRLGQRLVASIAPSIFGHEFIKTALALSMFGAESKDAAGRHRIRGDINVLMLGDPGMAKSQFLKYVEKTSHRAVFTTGQGASAVGLTASVHKDPITREWTLEGGALVLADQGVCMIDEFDKMSDQDRTSIHEAMEQQSISVSKAGIVTTLQARCAIIAAANPIKGRYDPSISFAENVELGDPILSRFDILAVVRDTVDPVQDESLANFVVTSHMRSHPHSDPNDASFQNSASGVKPVPGSRSGPVAPIPQALLRKYIMYAKQEVKPSLANMDQEKITSVFSKLRAASMTADGIDITVRHVESMVRIAEAHARMHLRAFVNDDDVDMAIRMMLESFISAQKYSVQRSLQRDFMVYINKHRDDAELLLHVLQDMMRGAVAYAQIRDPQHQMPKRIAVDEDEFSKRASELNIHSLTGFYASHLFTNNKFELVEDGGKTQIVKSW